MIFLHNIFNGIWAIEKDTAANYLPLIASYLKADSGQSFNSAPVRGKEELTAENSIRVMTMKNDIYIISDYGQCVEPEDAPQGSVAVININGCITKYDQECGPAGMKTKSELMIRCSQNSNIVGIALVIDSGGGETRAMRLMSDTINSVKQIIPVGAFIDDAAYSAAAGMASACDFIIANNKDAGFGSFGTYATIVDYDEYYKKMGVNIIEVYADASSDKNQEFIQAIKGDDTLLKAHVNKVNESFLAMVEKNRAGKITVPREEWATGKTFCAPEAIKMGLIDGIGSFEKFINFFNV